MTNEFKIAAIHCGYAQDIYDLLDSALFGGSNYWYWLPDMHQKETLDWYNSLSEEQKKENKFGDNTCELGFFRMLCDHSFGWEVTDSESEDHLGYFNYFAMLRGLKLMAEEYPRHWENFKNECWDAETADVFFQLAVMGEIVFG
jgi:hypothetical protein